MEQLKPVVLSEAQLKQMPELQDMIDGGSAVLVTDAEVDAHFRVMRDTAGVNAVIERNAIAAKARALRQVALDTDRSKLRACRKQNAHGGTISSDKDLAKLHTPRQQRKLMKMLRRADRVMRP